MAANASTLLRDEVPPPRRSTADVSSRRPADESSRRPTAESSRRPAAEGGDQAWNEVVDEQWRQSLLDVMRQVIHSLPDQTSLGELVAATRANPHLAPTLSYMSVQELIDMAVARPSLPTNGEAKKAGRRRAEPEIQFDEEGNPIMDLPETGPAVIRRRADVPDGDYRILRTLADEGPLGETALIRATKLTSEQLKLVLRHLRTKGWIHVEGSGPKRKVKITRNGASHLRKLNRKHGVK